MPSIQIYLNFDGNCEEAFNFYRSVFGGEFTYIGRFKDMPPSEEGKSLGPEYDEQIMHISLPIGDGTSLMGSDVGGEWSQHFKPGNNFAISLNAGTQAEADRLFNALSEGGTVTMPMAMTFWQSYFGMFVDKFGIHWMVSATPEK